MLAVFSVATVCCSIVRPCGLLLGICYNSLVSIVLRLSVFFKLYISILSSFEFSVMDTMCSIIFS